MRIRLKLSIVTVSMLVVPLTLISIFFLVNTARSMEEQIAKRLVTVGAFKAGQIESFMRERNADLLFMQHDPTVKAALPVFIRNYRTRMQPQYVNAMAIIDSQSSVSDSLGLYNAVLFTDTNGIVCYASDSALENKILGERLPDFVSDQLLRKVLRANCYSEIFHNTILREPVDGMYQLGVVVDEQGCNAGIVAMEINLDNIYRLMIDKAGIGATGETILAKKNSDSIVQFISPLLHVKDPPDSGSGKLYVLPPLHTVRMGAPIGVPIQRAASGLTGYGTALDYRGKKVLASWQGIPGFHWGLIAKVDWGEIDEPITKLLGLLVSIIAVTVVCSLIIALAFAKSIADPIRHLHEGTIAIGDGNMDHTVSLSSTDEIGQLSRAFDTMVARIKQITASRDELEKTARKLEQSNAELEQFAYVASHDLQEPLRVVVSYLQLLQTRYSAILAPTGGHFIERAIEATIRMRSMIHSVLMYSRIVKHGRPLQQCSCSEIVQNAVRNLQVKILEKRASVVAEPLPDIVADAAQIERLFQNLISNAIKFCDKPQPIVRIFAVTRNKATVFSVADNGLGIEEQYFTKIFEIFQRLHTYEKFEGTGIGLAAAKKIVQLHGGRIWVESTPGKGSTFSFTLSDHQPQGDGEETIPDNQQPIKEKCNV
jgi:signal transduction histidine kinase